MTVSDIHLKTGISTQINNPYNDFVILEKIIRLATKT